MGHKTYYQYYTNVNYLSCADCLAWHGKICTDPKTFPNKRDSCERKILALEHKDIKYSREKAKRMRAVAKAELTRRELLSDAKKALGNDNEVAIDLLTRAARIDVYIPEIERLTSENEEIFQSDETLRQRLCKLFTQSYSDKFGWPRYELLPEPMRFLRERAGIARIKQLLG